MSQDAVAATVGTNLSTPEFPLPADYGIEILRCEVGSTLHGTGLPDHEDRDEMGIYPDHQSW
jgi:hypothetical protein